MLQVLAQRNWCWHICKKLVQTKNTPLQVMEVSRKFHELIKNLFRFPEKVCKKLHKLIMNLKCFVKIMKIIRDFLREYSKRIINLRSSVRRVSSSEVSSSEVAECAEVAEVAMRGASRV